MLVVLIGGLTLVQYVFNLDLGIDQWLMQDYLTSKLHSGVPDPNSSLTKTIQLFFIKVERPFPGRPSPNTAFSFVLVGMSLLCLSWAQMPRYLWAKRLAEVDRRHSGGWGAWD